jgi:hypothetical protein
VCREPWIAAKHQVLIQIQISDASASRAGAACKQVIEFLHGADKAFRICCVL